VYDREKNIYIYIFKRGFFFYFTVRVLEMQNNKERNVVYRYSLFRFKK
jgi:glucan biosynthesis protein